MARAMGIVAFEGDNINIEGLSVHRPVMSISFLGRYRLIDFPISNFTNSKIDDIHIYVKNKPRSVYEHVGTGRHYNVNSKHGKLRVMYGEEEISSSVYNTDVRAYLQNESFIRENKNEYVIIAPAHYIYLQNFADVMDKHIESEADVTILYKSSRDAKYEFVGADTISIDRSKRVTGFGVNRGQANQRNISLECYVMKKTIFFDLLRKAEQTSAIYWFKNVIEESVYDYRMQAYSVKGTVLGIADLQSYYHSNLAMLDRKHSDLFTPEWPIYTRTSDSPPTMYTSNAEVSISSIANGAVIKGKVVNSVIGRNVVIEPGAVVEDSIVLPSAYIGPDVHVKSCVVDRHVRIEKTKELVGTKDNPIYINRHDKL